MKFITIITCVFIVFNAAYANIENQPLEQEQINNIFSSLKNQKRIGWIPSGTIEGTHINIDFQSEKIVTTKEHVKYDSGKFRWSIEVDSHVNFDQSPVMSEKSIINSNRIYTWDGNDYSLYFKKNHNSVVSDGASDIPLNINGPLKAGVTPWGKGIYKLDELVNNLISAKYDAQGNIVMQIEKASEYSIKFKLDPSKNYAVLSQDLKIFDKRSLSISCSEYVKHGQFWIPTIITCDRNLKISEVNPDRYSDFWKITKVDLNSVTQEEFRPGYKDNTFVEYRTNGKIMSYHFKSGRNTEYMLEHRKYNAFSDRKNKNCATAALLYAASKYGKDINTGDFDDMISEDGSSTSLFEMQTFLKRKNLNCMAIKSDVSTLVKLLNYQIVLHFPKKKHYVILDHFEDGFAWLIDLNSDKFYYRLPMDIFVKKWSERTALLISNETLSVPDGNTIIPETELHEIKGSADDFGTYSCTDLIQEYDIQFCSQFSGICLGNYVIWYNRYGCEMNSEGDFCVGNKFIGNVYSLCIEDPYTPGSCTNTGEWFVGKYIHACK